MTIDADVFAPRPSSALAGTLEGPAHLSPGPKGLIYGPIVRGRIFAAVMRARLMLRFARSFCSMSFSSVWMLWDVCVCVCDFRMVAVSGFIGCV